MTSRWDIPHKSHQGKRSLCCLGLYYLAGNHYQVWRRGTSRRVLVGMGGVQVRVYALAMAASLASLLELFGLQTWRTCHYRLVCRRRDIWTKIARRRIYHKMACRKSCCLCNQDRKCIGSYKRCVNSPRGQSITTFDCELYFRGQSHPMTQDWPVCLKSASGGLGVNNLEYLPDIDTTIWWVPCILNLTCHYGIIR